jgi:3-hydroxymyristoyl/3-hydroxydecanoyl-(acyl carrier protein) dehydratase
VPGDRLIVAAEIQRLRRNLATFAAQAWVGGELVFEGLITGVRV